MDPLEARGAETLRQEYLERARELRPMLAAAGDEIERRREVTPEIVDALIERGIFRMLLPKSLGGAELDPLTYTAVLEELARGDGSPAWCLGQKLPAKCSVGRVASWPGARTCPAPGARSRPRAAIG